MLRTILALAALLAASPAWAIDGEARPLTRKRPKPRTDRHRV